jgi:tetratricopeptide (TPR) repeat protein
MEADMKSIRSLGMLLGLFLLVGCVANENYKTGLELSKNNRWDDASAYFEKAVQEAPENMEFKDALLKAKRASAKSRLDKVKESLGAEKEPTMPTLERLLKDAETMHKIDPDSKEIEAFLGDLNGKVASLKVRVKNLYDQAGTDIQKEDWAGATLNLRQVNKFDPGYEDTGNRLTKAEQEGAKVLYRQGVAFLKEEDIKMAVQSFMAAMDINSGYFDLAKLYEEAKSKDNAEYFLKEAEKAETAQKLDRAILMYEKAGEYTADGQTIQNKLDNLRAKAGQWYFDEAVGLLGKNKLYESIRKVEFVKKYAPDLQNGSLFKAFTNNLCEKLVGRAEEQMEKELWGNALIWLQKAEGLNPTYPNLFQKQIEVKDHINRRIKRAIAVFDFGNPANSKDAGKIAANKLITFLYKNASGDLRIIERENLQSILREMQLGQTGVVDMKSAQTLGKMQGIDVFVMGDVMRFETKTTDSPSTNQVKVLVDEEDIRNPDFSDWLMMHREPTAEQLKNAPPRTIKKRNYQFIPSRQGSAKINAIIEVSYKLVDTLTGENVFTNTISGKLVVEDKYQDALPAANIALDPLELPTEVEVMDELANTKILEMAQSVLKYYQSLEMVYFNQALQLLKRQNMDEAVEKFVDAIYDEKLKGISTPITVNSTDQIDQLIRDK